MQGLTDRKVTVLQIIRAMTQRVCTTGIKSKLFWVLKTIKKMGINGPEIASVPPAKFVLKENGYQSE